jgi:hypothetical protein
MPPGLPQGLRRSRTTFKSPHRICSRREDLLRAVQTDRTQAHRRAPARLLRRSVRVRIGSVRAAAARYAGVRAAGVLGSVALTATAAWLGVKES